MIETGCDENDLSELMQLKNWKDSCPQVDVSVGSGAVQYPAEGTAIVHILSGGEVRWAVRMDVTLLGKDTTRPESLFLGKNFIFPLKPPPELYVL